MAIVLSSALVLAALGTVVVRDARRRYLVLGLAVASFVLAVLTFTLVWGALALAGPTGLELGARYMVVPTLALFSALIVCLDSALERVPLAWPRAAVASLVFATVATIGVIDYHVWTNRADAMRWSDSLDVASLSCEDPAATGGLAQIAPLGFANVGVPCDVLEGRQP